LPNTNRVSPGKKQTVSDITKSISKDFGVLAEKDGIALRGTFIMDPSGTVRHMHVNDLGVGRSVDEILRLVEGFQFAAEHGEVCPANWTRGSKTINPAKADEYFGSVN
jgi:alkyl hydroperoxide reductase subunit AhpC